MCRGSSRRRWYWDPALLRCGFRLRANGSSHVSGWRSRTISPRSRSNSMKPVGAALRRIEIRRRTTRAAGFTLLEVLVALVIIGVALAAAMRGAMSLTNAAEGTRLKLLATLTAENRLLELRLARRRLDVGQNTADCEQAGIPFACEQ